MSRTFAGTSLTCCQIYDLRRLQKAIPSDQRRPDPDPWHRPLAPVSAAQADPDLTNNSASMTLSLYPLSDIPALSDLLLLLLAAVLALAAALRLRD